MKTLSRKSLQRALAFVERSARPVDAAVFRLFFNSGKQTDVESALTAFQNPDGGFGRALEPDLRCAASTPLATTVGLQYARAAGMGSDSRPVRQAMHYLVDSFHPEIPGWPQITPQAAEAPHAPWWDYSHEEARKGDQKLWGNPNAEITGYLIDYPALCSKQMAETMIDAAAHNLDVLTDDMEPHVLLCYARLVERENLPGRTAFIDKLCHAAQKVVARTPAEWSKYGLKPLWVAPTPESPLADALSDVTPANLDYEIDTQQADGSWVPPWSWGDRHPDEWQKARVEWAGHLTVNTLRTLRAYGRIEGM